MKSKEKKYLLRHELLTRFIPDYAGLAGMEIGALCYPTVKKNEGNIKFLDRQPKAEILKVLGAAYPDAENTFVDVDIVSYDRPLNEVLAGYKFDYIIGNHLLEHIPDFIGFFKTLYDVLNDNGRIFLAIPDRRFTFDHNRTDTLCGHFIREYESSRSIDCTEHFLDAMIYNDLQPDVTWDAALREQYSFIHHHHVFCYESFMDKVVKPLIKLRYLDFSLTAYHYEKDLQNEFIAVFQKVAPGSTPHVLGQAVKLQAAPCSVNVFPPETLARQIADVVKSGAFCTDFYMKKYPECIYSGLDPLQHYFFIGKDKGYDPSPDFSTIYYLQNNPDVSGSCYNPFWHYLMHGKGEGRQAAAAVEVEK